MLFLPSTNKIVPSNVRRYFILRVFDVMVASLAFMVVFPVFLMVAILLMMETDESIFISQEYYDRDGRKVNMFGFRNTGLISLLYLDKLPRLFNVIRGDISLFDLYPQINGASISDYTRR